MMHEQAFWCAEEGEGSELDTVETEYREILFRLETERSA